MFEINNFVNDRIEELADAEVVSEDYIVKAKSITQIAQSLPAGNPQTEQIVERVVQFTLEMLNFDYKFEGDQIGLKERLYGLFLLTVQFL